MRTYMTYIRAYICAYIYDILYKQYFRLYTGEKQNLAVLYEKKRDSQLSFDPYFNMLAASDCYT